MIYTILSSSALKEAARCDLNKRELSPVVCEQFAVTPSECGYISKYCLGVTSGNHTLPLLTETTYFLFPFELF